MTKNEAIEEFLLEMEELDRDADKLAMKKYLARIERNGTVKGERIA